MWIILPCLFSPKKAWLANHVPLLYVLFPHSAQEKKTTPFSRNDLHLIAGLQSRFELHTLPLLQQQQQEEEEHFFEGVGEGGDSPRPRNEKRREFPPPPSLSPSPPHLLVSFGLRRRRKGVTMGPKGGLLLTYMERDFPSLMYQKKNCVTIKELSLFLKKRTLLN